MHTGKFKRFRFTVTLQEEYTFVITDYVCLFHLIFKHNTKENCEINKSSATEVYMRSGENFENKQSCYYSQVGIKLCKQQLQNQNLSGLHSIVSREQQRICDHKTSVICFVCLVDPCQIKPSV